MHTRAHQRGWAGLIGLLIALLLVFLLGKTLLQQTGMLSAAKPATAASRPGTVQTEVTTPPPMEALERARGLEAQVQQQAREQQERIDKMSQ